MTAETALLRITRHQASKATPNQGVLAGTYCFLKNRAVQEVEFILLISPPFMGINLYNFFADYKYIDFF